MPGPEDKRRSDDPDEYSSRHKDLSRRAKQFAAKKKPGHLMPGKFDTLKKTDGKPKKRFS